MASNDSGVDTSNDSNDGNLVYQLPLYLPSDLSNFLKKTFETPDINFPINAFDRELPLIFPSSLPSSSHSYKMKCRLHLKKRHYDTILTESCERKLRLAATTCNLELLTKLLDNGVDPNSSDEHKRSPLHLAACRGYAEIVAQLLRYGANPNIMDSLGNTPLHLAVISASSSNYNLVVRSLLQSGASVLIYDRSGKTPFELAESKWRIFKMRYENTTPEKENMLQEMIILIGILVRYLHIQKKALTDLDDLEKRLSNLSTEDQVAETDALLTRIEALSLNK